MSDHSTEPPDSRGNDRSEERDTTTIAERGVSAVSGLGRNGTAAILAGAGLLVRAALTATRNGRRAAVQALVGAALVGLGRRQRRSEGGVRGDEAVGEGGGKKVSDDAYAARMRHDVLGFAEGNPRGVSEEPDVETETDPREGAIRFTDEQDDGPRPRPHLDDGDPEDPRYEGVGDDEEGVEIELSDAAMADEASEAAGPTPEQAQPTQTEGTEPEPTPEEDVAPAHVEGEEPGGGDAPADGPETRSGETGESGSVEGSDVVDEDDLPDEESEEGTILRDDELSGDPVEEESELFEDLDEDELVSDADEDAET